MLFNRQAAQGDLIHNSDTTMKILALIQNNDQSERKGIFSTGILSTLNDQKIALFFTGRKYADGNLADLLQQMYPSVADTEISFQRK